MIGVPPTEVDSRFEAVLAALLREDNQQIDDVLGYKIQSRQLLVDILPHLLGDLDMNAFDINIHPALLSVV